MAKPKLTNFQRHPNHEAAFKAFNQNCRCDCARCRYSPAFEEKPCLGSKGVTQCMARWLYDTKSGLGAPAAVRKLVDIDYDFGKKFEQVDREYRQASDKACKEIDARLKEERRKRMDALEEEKRIAQNRVNGFKGRVRKHKASELEERREK